MATYQPPYPVIESIQAIDEVRKELGFLVKTNNSEIELILRGEVSCCEEIEAKSYPLNLNECHDLELVKWSILQQDTSMGKVEGEEGFIAPQIIEQLGLDNKTKNKATYLSWIILELVTIGKNNTTIYLAISNHQNGDYSHQAEVNYTKTLVSTYL